MRRPLLLLSILLVAAACDDAGRSTGPVMGNVPRYTISDGANSSGGPANGDFFFLPPMVSNPSASPAFDAGAFDATRQPRVVICRLTLTVPQVCDLELASFSGSDIAVSTTDEQYQVNWRTDLYDLQADRLYRIMVSVPRDSELGPDFFTLGYADVQPVSNGSGLKKVDSDEYIGLVDGRTLPIKFRIERSPRCETSDDCIEAVVSNEGGRVETESGYAVAIFPAGWLPEGFENVIVAVRNVPIGTGAGQEISCHGSLDREYEGCYDFATFPAVGEFALPVTVAVCIEPDALLVEDYLQLYASDDGENRRALPPAEVIIECEGFAGTQSPVPPIGFMDRVGDRLLALGARLGGALSPREAHAIDLGRGGLITGFSHVGWVLVAELQDPPSEGDDFAGAPASQQSASVRVLSAHDSDGPRIPLAGFLVSFTVTAGGGSVDPATAITGPDGYATTTWTLGAEGAQSLAATAVGASGTATLTAALVEEQIFMLTFDTDPNGEPIAPGTIVNETYAGWGVSLRRVGEWTACSSGGANAFANDHGPGGFGSGQNNVTVCPQGIASDFNEDFFGRLEATFAEAASRVCVDVWPTAEGGVSFLEAFDGEGALVAGDESTPGENETMCVEASEIYSVQFAGRGSLHAIFDNLEVSF